MEQQTDRPSCRDKRGIYLRRDKESHIGATKKKKNIHKFDENRGDKNEAAFNHILELVWCL